MRVVGLVLIAACHSASSNPSPVIGQTARPIAHAPRSPLDRVALAAARSASANHVIEARALRDAMTMELGSGLSPYVLAARGSKLDAEAQLVAAFAELRETVEITSVGRATADGPDGRVRVIVALPAPTLPITIERGNLPMIRVPWPWPAEPAAFTVTPTETRRLRGTLERGTFALAIDCFQRVGTVEIAAGSRVVASVKNACGPEASLALPDDAFDAGPPARTRVEVEQRLFELVNRERRTRGLPSVAWDEDAHRFAREHSAEMAAFRFVGHEAADGRSAQARLRTLPARAVYENVGHAGGPGEAHNGFMTSRGHRANLLSDNVERGAIGVEPDPRDPRAYYVTEIFLRGHR
jgi:uncharacterized protein YkwD